MPIDHLTIAGPDLAVLQRAFEAAGMATDYGGPHSNGITHMALLGFDNSSYIEVVSTLTPGSRVPLGRDYLLGPRGGTAWTVDAPDVSAATRAAQAAGISATAPVRMQRRKPDGATAEWELAYLGDRQPGGLLPFLIHDITARTLRSRPSPSVAGRLRGLSHVVLAVEDAAAAATELGKIFPLREPSTFEADYFGRLTRFPGSPIILADAPEHRRTYGESPCAAVIAAYDLDAVRRDYQLREPSAFAGQPVVWLKNDMPCRIGLGRDAP
jgi:hypothetical protein